MSRHIHEITFLGLQQQKDPILRKNNLSRNTYRKDKTQVGGLGTRYRENEQGPRGPQDH